MTIRDLEPKLIWEQFDDITRVPRPSKREEKIIEWLVAFAEKHGFDYQKDATGNVVIRKAATAGYENRPAVILQSHMDMIAQKEDGVDFDFTRDPIRLIVSGNELQADGTTLGADDGGGHGRKVEGGRQRGKDTLIEVTDGGIEGGQHTDRTKDHARDGQDGGDEPKDAGG